MRNPFVISMAGHTLVGAQRDVYVHVAPEDVVSQGCTGYHCKNQVRLKLQTAISQVLE